MNDVVFWSMLSGVAGLVAGVFIGMFIMWFKEEGHKQDTNRNEGKQEE